MAEIINQKDHPSIVLKNEMMGSLLRFTQLMYRARTNRDFALSYPNGRESHYITVCRELTSLFFNPTYDLLINMPPGYGKSTLVQHFIAWCYTWYSDCNFLYISYSKALAEKHTGTLKHIIEMPEYQDHFDVILSDDSSAKGNFKTINGGTVMAFGAAGSVTGQDAGLPNCPRFSGAVIIDDAHKPDEVHSDTIRQSVIDNYNETIKQRPRGENVPIIFIGQCLHEGDLAAFLKSGVDGRKRKCVVLKAIDEAGNALCPNINSLQMLRREEKTNPYVFAAQYQQDPQPSGGGIFKKEWFKRVDFEPPLVASFIIVDSAETANEANDATVFSHFGLYKVMIGEVDTGLYGLHWIDCVEEWYEPKDLEAAFLSFYSRAMQHTVKPQVAAIEKKSTGSTLLSLMKKYPGLNVVQIENNITAKNKISRFLLAQPYVAQGLITVLDSAQHADNVIEHCRKITLNKSHLRDDIADTLAYGIKLGLVDKVILHRSIATDYSSVAKSLNSKTNKINQLQQKAYQR